MEFRNPLAIKPKTTFYVARADELHDLPPLLPIPGLFPAHRLSLVVGTSGTGLTQLACHLASCLAGPAPLDALDPDDDTEPEDDEYLKEEAFREEHYPDIPAVLLVSQRDNADVIKPRLKALGANLRRIMVLSEVTEREDVPGDFPNEVIRPLQTKDHQTLSRYLHSNKGIGLVIIDNADWMFAGTNHPTRAQLQRQLACLEAVAVQREVAIVLLTTTPNLTANPFPNRLLQTLHDACRAVHILAPDLPAPNTSADLDAAHSPANPDTRLLFTIKTPPKPPATPSASKPSAQPTPPSNPNSVPPTRNLAVLLNNPVTQACPLVPSPLGEG